MTQPTKQTKRPSLGDDLDRRVRAAYEHHDSAPFPSLRGRTAPARRPPRRVAVLAVAATVAAVVAAPIALSQFSNSGSEAGLEASARPTADQTSANSIDAAVFRGSEDSSLSDYVSVPTLTEEVDRYQVAVSGRILSWSEGRVVSDGDVTTRYATLAIEVEHASKVVDDSQREVAYFSVERGMEWMPVGEELTPEYAPPTVQEFEDAAPVGTRIIAIGFPLDGEFVNAGLPDGEPLIGLSTQGALLETENGGFDTMRVPVEDVAGWARNAATLAGSNASTHESPGSFQNLVDELSAIE